MSPEEGKEVIIEYNKMKSERDTLIDDLTWYKAKVERLERENEDLKFTKKMHLGHIKYFSNNNELLRDEVKSLKQENKELLLQIEELESEINDRDEWALLKMEQEGE
ncbi:hypothetical protein [Staphylococcus arlettae]|uniref:hypothetical protein n=1 Tax=Staphylococcus arlettae TaxID=29378 RepID=UPI0021D2CB49|nr:hypothetical protein [Staphylococcus arlettae]UXU53193.1 hypothetical protein MUA71_03705 [Staphylococcus arlettae]